MEARRALPREGGREPPGRCTSHGSAGSTPPPREPVRKFSGLSSRPAGERVSASFPAGADWAGEDERERHARAKVK